jgi:hypothetical protein
MKIAHLPSARLLLWPLYFAIVTAGCGRVTPRDISEDGGSATSSPGEDAAQTPVLDAAPTTPTAQSDAAPKGTPAEADAAAAPDPKPAGEKDAGMAGDPKGPGPAVSTAGCKTKDDCGGLVCSLPDGICVECLVDHDCKGKAKTCDPKTFTCIGCTDDCADGD